MPIKLYQFPCPSSLPNLSPFCMKLETVLRMAQIPYEVVTTRNTRRGPKGKLPFIEDQGKLIADSALIIHHLKNKHGLNLEKNLSPQQKATGLAFSRMLEEHFHWAMIFSRWIDPQSSPQFLKIVLGPLPAPLRIVAKTMICRRISNNLYAQGLGRHQPDEIYRLALEDLDAVATFLENKSFLLGEEPCLWDASAFSYLANLVYVRIPSPLQQAAEGFPQVLAYCDRMMARYFPEFSPHEHKPNHP